MCHLQLLDLVTLVSMWIMQRGGKPQEVANAILWLLSEESPYVTGSFIDLAGGL